MFVKDKHNWPSRFWAKVEKTSDCWLWRGAADKLGYGFFSNPFSRTPKMLRAYRLSYEIAKGKIPANRVLDHVCRNPRCVNPDHLEAVTMRENTLRGIGPTAKQARSTHCPQGHIYDYAYPDGRRGCRKCMNKQTVEWNKKHRDVVNEYQRKWRLKNKTKIA